MRVFGKSVQFSSILLCAWDITAYCLYSMVLVVRTMQTLPMKRIFTRGAVYVCWGNAGEHIFTLLPLNSVLKL